MNGLDGNQGPQAVLRQLKLHGPATARELSDRIGITPVAIRQHLTRLAADGLVADRRQPNPVGRPSRRWSLTDAADTRFGDSHAELAVGMLDAARAAFGVEGLEKLIAQRAGQQLERYRELMPDSDAPLEERLSRLATIRADDGYMAEAERAGDGTLLLVENHCPICAAATVCKGLCTTELDLFRQLLGSGVSVERTEHILDGSRRCVYEVRTVGDD